MKTTVFCIILLLCLTSLSDAARFDTSFNFSTIETQHFSIHFHQGLEEAARKSALFAEGALRTLTREFNWQPKEKTEIVLIDDSDFANGFATALPYNTIYIKVVPPSIASMAGEYDDWLKVVITHEYAHILTLDPSRGYWNVMRAIFGKPVPAIDPVAGLLFLVTAPPNSFLPRWWHEGIATWAETEYSSKGRGRSSFYDMFFRMAVAEDNLPTIAQINGDLPEWPSGNLPYLYGYRLQRYIVETYGKDAPGKLNLAHAGRFPYLISAPLQELTGGKSYRDLYDDMLAAVKREESESIAILSRVPFTPLKTVSTVGESLSNPRYSPDGSRIAFTKRDPHDQTTTVITDRSGSHILAESRRRYSDGSVCWSPDGGTLYFTQPKIIKGNVYQDLFSYDFTSRSATRLTKGQRLGDPDLSPDGKLFAAVITSRGSQNLALLEMNGAGKLSAPRKLTDYSMQRLSSPRWSPDAANISYTLTDNSGRSAIHLYNIATGKDTPLLTVDHTAAYPVWSRDGSFLIYVSDETGVFNLFAYNLKEGKSYQVSHLLGGAMQPDISPDGSEVVFSSYNSRGLSIVKIPLDREKWLTERGPSLMTSRQAPASVSPVNSEKVEGATQVTSTSYSPVPTLFPTFWLPRITGDGSGSPVYGLFTAGSDVLGYNSYVLTADYSTGRSRSYFDLSYQNDNFFPTLFMKAHAKPLLYSNLQQRGDYYETSRSLTLGTSFPIISFESRYIITAGYQIQDQEALSSLDSRDRFNGIPVFQGRRDSLFTALNFDNVSRYPYSISSEEGRRISLKYRRYGRELGNDQELSEYSAEYQEFIRLPTAAMKHQVLYLRLAGALADSSHKYGQQSFQIGGIPSELNPYPLRGYPERLVAGKYVASGTLEYRAPLFYPFKGPGTLPFLAEKVHGALFVDAGEAWDGNVAFRRSNLKVGAGAELRMDVTLGYWLKVTPALGFAQGLSSGGDKQIYLTLYINL